MPIPAFESVPDAGANTNFKLYGDAGAAVPLLQSQNSASHANRVSTLAESSLAAWGNRFVTVDVVEAVAAEKMLTGRHSQGIGEAIALAQILVKTAQTTPPPTER
jgi:hypothetical protein